MHLVFLNQYYPPDGAPTGVMLAAVAERLAADGHEVSVLCATGGYAGSGGGSNIERRTSNVEGWKQDEGRCVRVIRIEATRFGRGTFAGKLADYLSYSFGVAWKLTTLRPRPDRIVALTTPPYLSVLARLLSKFRGCDHAHWVMDLYPDVMVAHGMLREDGWAHRMLAGWARFGFGGKRCVRVLTLGPDMAERTARHRGAGAPPVDWVPLWGGGRVSDDRSSEQVHALRKKRGWSDAERVVMYSGNMGLGHRFDEILEAARALVGEPVRFVFFGGGKRRAEIERFVREHPELGVELHDYAPAEELSAHLRTADVQLASLAPEWTGTMVPSKLQGIFSAGRPVIFMGAADSSIGRWVAESGGGWIVEPGDIAGLLAALREAADATECRCRGARAAEFAAAHFDPTRNVSRISELLAH